MRLSKEEIAAQVGADGKVGILKISDTGNVRAQEKVHNSAQYFVAKIKEDFKISFLPLSLRNEITATCNFLKEKAMRNVSIDEIEEDIEMYFSDIAKAVQAGEFKQETTQRKTETATANKTQTAKAPKDTANTFQKIHFDEERKYVSTPKPKTELGSQVADKFFQFEQSLKEQGIKLSINAINAIKIKRNNLVNMASFPKTADTAIQKADEQLAIYAEHIKQGNLQEHLLNSMISALQSAYLELVQSKAQTQTTEQKAPQAKKDKIFDEKAVQNSEIKAAWQEAKKAWIEEGKSGVLQHIADDYTKLSNLAQQSATLQEFKDGFAKLDAEVKADAQNPKRAQTASKAEKYATKATAPKSEPQANNESESTAHQTQFGNGEDSAALNELKANPPQNTQAVKQDNKVSYSRATHRQTQPNT